MNWNLLHTQTFHFAQALINRKGSFKFESFNCFCTRMIYSSLSPQLLNMQPCLREPYVAHNAYV